MATALTYPWNNAHRSARTYVKKRWEKLLTEVEWWSMELLRQAGEVASATRNGSLSVNRKSAAHEVLENDGRNRTLRLLAVPAGNRTLVLANAEMYPDMTN
jgi:hypothetical protein